MALLLLLIFGLVCHGWGRCVSVLCCRQKNGFAFEVALGLAALSVVGGWLNAFGLAKGPALYALCAIGAALWLNSVRKSLLVCARSLRTVLSERRFGCQELARVAPYIVMTLAAGFFCLTLMPAAVLNFADDMHTYLVRPFRMLATGTIGGNPFDMLGLDSLGAQSFFQSFILLWAPLTWANGFDAVFCFGICGFLIIEIARRLELSWKFSLLAMVAFISINPQVVNISSVYSGSLMILGIFLASWKLVENLASDNGSCGWRAAIPLGLFVAALLALKNTFALFIIVQLPLFLAWLLSAGTCRRPAVLSTVSAVTTIAVALFPWLVVTLSTYGIPGSSVSNEFTAAPLAAKYPSLVAQDIKGLFHGRDPYYGGNQFIYNLLALGLAVCAAAAIILLRTRETALEQRSWRPIILSFVPVSIAGFAAYILNAHLNDAESATRYSCPLFLPLVPLAGLVISRLLAMNPFAGPQLAVTPPSPLKKLVPVIVPMTVIILFAPMSLKRFEQALNVRTLISFPIKQANLDYNLYALGHGGVRTYALQRRIRAGETILAWVAQPFRLDYARNKVLNISSPGLINPWLRFPAGITDSELRQYLRAHGIRYVLFQSDGSGLMDDKQLEQWLGFKYPIYRKMAAYSLYLRTALLQMSETSRVLYRDSEMVLFDIDAGQERIVTENKSH